MRDFESPPQFNSENELEKNEQSLLSSVEQTGSPPTSKIIETLGGTKERISTYLKYKGLKVKEYFGRLTQEDFDQLLDFDFQEQLKDVPPIEGVFSPEDELTKIKSLPKEQRREALTTFKENLVRQREALAAMRIFIERSIEFNHDVPRKKLLGLVEKFSAQYGFTDRQKQVTEQLIDGYYDNRQRALEIRKKYTDDIALVNELSGLNFDNTVKFDISTGPMSVDIVTDGFNANRIYEKSKDVIVELPYRGFAARSLHELPVLYVVISTSSIPKSILKHKGMLKSTLIHEHEHQKNRLFRAIFDKEINLREEYTLLYQYEAEHDPETKRELLEAYFHLKRQRAFQYAKDEVIAIKKDRGYEFYDFFFEKDNSQYDYLAYIRDWKDKKDDALWQEVAQKVLVEDYKKIFEGAVASFDRLEKGGGYTREEIIAMFADKALPEWPKITRRLLEQKRKR